MGSFFLLPPLLIFRYCLLLSLLLASGLALSAVMVAQRLAYVVNNFSISGVANNVILYSLTCSLGLWCLYAPGNTWKCTLEIPSDFRNTQ